jgi:Domain of unknown function (DUF5916)/Carbohydrate family 9 binding domain-like
MRWTSIVCILIACFVTTSVRAQVTNNASQPDKTPQEKAAAEIWRIDAVTTDIPPVVDGKLDDEVWKNAKPVENFTQTDPVEGASPSQRTVVRVLVDKDNLYIAVRCYDDHPELLIGKELGRDASFRSDDRITVTLDPFGTLRDGFIFQLSVTGAWRDGLLENNRRRRIEWDGIWWGKTSTDDEGWSAEFRIPAKTLSFDPNAQAWGVNIERVIRRDNERVRWATPTLNSSMIRLADAGSLHGIDNLQQGIGLDVKPSLSLTTRDTGVTTFDPSLDIFYKITPDIQATLTLNTDFAETEVDARQVNLTRFSLFFPEKRAFFLQDAGIFEFGGIRQSPLPFFSRRIGISGGAQKDILGGFKVTGRTDKWTFGALNVQMKDDPVLGSKNLGVMRARYNLSDTTGFGFIATNGDPSTTGNNTVLGADFDFFFPEFNGTNSLQGSAYFLKSFSSGTGADNDGDGNAFGARLSYPNDKISFFLFAGQVDKGFNPALGFAPRRGEREYGANFRYRWRPQRFGIRRIDLTGGAFVTTALSNTINSANYTLPRLDIQDNIGDRFSLFFSPRRERLTAPFNISSGVTLPVGTYDYNRFGVSFSTATSRPISARLSFEDGGFFNGRRTDYTIGLDLRPSKHFFFSFQLTQNDVNLDEGSFITRIAQARFNIAFTPDVSWSNFVQYDNVTDTAGINSRFRWIIRPGSDLFVVVNQGFDLSNDSFRTAGTQLTTKIGWTFRY